VLAILARLVPGRRRGDWLREWQAEAAFQDRLAVETGAGALARMIIRGRMALDAAEDAVGMWRRDPGGSAAGLELRLAVRALRHSPFFTLATTITLALAIGASTAIFSVVEGVLVRPLPYRAPNELLEVVLSFRSERGERPIAASEPEFLEVRAAHPALSGLAGYWSGSVNLGGASEPTRVPAASVSADFLSVLGVAPALGRGLAPGEDEPGHDGVVVLTDGLWRRAFGSDPGVLGRDILLDGSPYQVVGVLPGDFVFPGSPVDLLRPNPIDRANPAGRSSHYLTMVGRLRPGTTLEAARAGNEELLARWALERPGVHGPSPTHPLTLRPLRDAMVGDVRNALLVLLGAVALVLLIACANVAALFVVRAEQRQQETGIRVALGAGLSGVSRAYLLESALVSLIGAGAGVVLAGLAIGSVQRAGPAVVHAVGGLHMDPLVLAFAATLTVACALLFGVTPALAASRGDPLRLLRDGGRTDTGSRSGLSLRRSLVVLEVALSVTLVAASALMIRSFGKLRSVDPGFDPEGVVTMEFALDATAYPDAEAVAAFHERLDARLVALRGIRAAGAIRALPFVRGAGIESMRPLDRPIADGDFWNAAYQVASPGYFEAMGIPLLEGRAFEVTDRADAPAVAIVSRAMAQQYWKGESPLGERLQLGMPQNGNPELTVVGVVGDVRHGGYDAGIGAFMYVPRAQAGAIYGGLATRLSTLVVRSDLDPSLALSTARGVIAQLDPSLPVVAMATLPAVLSRSVTDERFLTILVAVFTGLALVLGAVGIGGLMSYVVTRRTRELGLRLALGAPRGRILALVLRQAMVLTALGTALGVGGSLLAGRALSGQLFQVGARDPVALAFAPAMLFLVALGAAYLPARRATRVDPVEAMRAET